MSHQPKECCEKCTYLIGGLMHGNREVCNNSSCSCHSTEQNKEENKGCNCKKLGYFSENCEVHKSLSTLVPHSHLDSLPPQEQPKEEKCINHCAFDSSLHIDSDHCGRIVSSPSQPNEQWKEEEREAFYKYASWIKASGIHSKELLKAYADFIVERMALREKQVRKEEDHKGKYELGLEIGRSSRDSDWKAAIESELKNTQWFEDNYFTPENAYPSFDKKEDMWVTVTAKECWNKALRSILEKMSTPKESKEDKSYLTSRGFPPDYQ